MRSRAILRTASLIWQARRNLRALPISRCTAAWIPAASAEVSRTRASYHARPCRPRAIPSRGARDTAGVKLQNGAAISMLPNKACPVVVRRRASRNELLVLRHPLAGVQLVKGTIEPGEDPGAAALRELAEEAGILSATLGRHLGTWNTGHEGQVWALFEIWPASPPPDRWQHFTSDGGGHWFAFFWHPVDEPTTEAWHPLFRSALDYIVGAAHRP
jgi:8-oxo-dGTP pyrophosphatase MutT (NUDIX family)